MKQVLVCKKCAAILSKPVIIYDESLGRRKGGKGYLRVPASTGSGGIEIVPKREAGNPVTPAGTVLKLKQPYFHRDIPDLSYVVRLDDLTNLASANESWQMGCCGALAGDHPNRSCKCGIGIGFEDSECYTEHWFLPDPKVTKWQNVKS